MKLQAGKNRHQLPWEVISVSTVEHNNRVLTHIGDANLMQAICCVPAQGPPKFWFFHNVNGNDAILFTYPASIIEEEVEIYAQQVVKL